MSNDSVLSLGLFGRLSVLEAQRSDVIQRIKHVASDKTRLGGAVEEESPQDVLNGAFPILLTELNGLVESIVLSDHLIEFLGYNLESVSDLNVRQFGAS